MKLAATSLIPRGVPRWLPEHRRVVTSGDAGPFFALMSNREKSEFTNFFNNPPFIRFAALAQLW